MFVTYFLSRTKLNTSSLIGMLRNRRNISTLSFSGGSMFFQHLCIFYSRLVTFGLYTYVQYLPKVSDAVNRCNKIQNAPYGQSNTQGLHFSPTIQTLQWGRVADVTRVSGIIALNAVLSIFWYAYHASPCRCANILIFIYTVCALDCTYTYILVHIYPMYTYIQT